MNRFSIDNAFVVDWNATVKSSHRLQTIPNVISGLEVKDNTCNDDSLTEVDLSRFQNMRKIEIGSNSLNQVSSLSLSNMPKLNSFTSGMNSLSQSQAFIASNNPLLQQIGIGDQSFQLSSSFLLNELPKISSLEIGSNCFKGSEKQSQQQYSSSLSFVLSDFDELRTVKLSSDSFTHFDTFEVSGKHIRIMIIIIVDCSNLIQLEIGNTTQSSSPSPDNNMFTAVEQVTVRSTIFTIFYC